jgi:hypothetical protein
VRRRGRFQTVEDDLAFNDALEIGKREIRESSAASFRIVDDGRVVELEGLGLEGDLRKSKVDDDVVVERRDERIDTPGELREITEVGIAVSSRQNANKRRTEQKNSNGNDSLGEQVKQLGGVDIGF